MDPLAQLQDIHLPEQINNYPVAPGWIALYLLTIALFVLVVVQFKKRSLRHKNKKKVLKQLVTANNATELIKLLKWALLAYFPREYVANLSGKNLHDFMLATLPQKYQPTFEQQCQQLLTQYYQQSFTEDDNKKLKIAVSYWIKHALPPKKSTMEKLNTQPVSSKITPQEAT